MVEIENTWITLQDGRRLAARIWLPDNVEAQSSPAVLEYLPYRKRDGTAPRDESTYPAYAAAGIAGVRVDISGNGDSDGDFDDEYSPRELTDCVEVIHWIAKQPWCNGNVGMMGISWGGFNSLQVAAMNPDPLKAVIAIGTTVDRYNDDIHYKNGCLLYSNFQWSSTMLCFASRPPDPLVVGDRWREMWKHRLETQPFPLEAWLSHQRRDAYWKHGSVCEDYGAIRIPALVISGWADGYINAPPAMAANGPTARAINGPWIHKYPHFAWPKPRMDFIGESVHWWRQWLADEDTGMGSLPAYRAFISEGVRPHGRRETEPGRWVAEETWPSTNIREAAYYPGGNGELGLEPGEDGGNVTICSPQDTGIACGEFFPMHPDAEMAGDQRQDDAGSAVFDTPVLNEAVEILGRPRVHLRITIDQPLGNLAVRLVDVHPDGAAHRVSWGVINLAHRNGNASPLPVSPGEKIAVVIELDQCGYRFPVGHRIRLAVSTAYWPMLVPPPAAITATLSPGVETRLCLPIRAGGDEVDIPNPANSDPLPDWPMHSPAAHHRVVERSLQDGLTQYRVSDDTGEEEIPPHGMRIRHTHEECYSIRADDPLSYEATSTYVSELARGDWKTRTVSESRITVDSDNFHIRASVSAWENDALIHQRHREKSIPRDHC
jgi:putative CocE/NonD family hydrolase